MSSPAAPSTTTRPWFDRLSLTCVVAGFAVLLALCAFLVSKYSNRVPERDDLELAFLFLPDATFPFVMGRLWAPLNEHRIFLSELVRYGLVAWTNDFRAAAWFQLTVIALLAATFVYVARRLRGGRTSVFDLVFPLVWLTWGNAENFLLGVQICLTFATSFACAALLAATWRPEPPSAARINVVGTSALMMPLCGGFGLCQAPAWLAWLAIIGVARLRTARDSTERRAGWIALAWCAAGIGLIVFYFQGLTLPDNGVTDKSVLRAFAIAGEFLSLIFGSAAFAEPYLTVIASVLLLGSGIAVAVRTLVKRPEERWRALGIGAAIGGTLALSLGIGWSRQDAWPVAGWAGRYVTAATPAFAACCLAFLLYLPRMASTIAFAVTSVVCAWLIDLNMLIGEGWAKARHDLVNSFTTQAQGGTPIPDLAKEYGLTMYVAIVDFQARIEMLQSAKLPPYDRGRVTTIDEGQLGVYLTANDIVDSSPPPLIRRVENLPAIAIHAPGSIRLWIPPGATRMNGVVGVLPIAYSRFIPASERTHGIRVFVEHVDASGDREVLFQRTLDPAVQALDRGMTPFKIEFDEGSEGEIVLRCESVDEDERGPDWSAWSFVPPR